jgi:hypothetical protein
MTLQPLQRIKRFNNIIQLASNPHAGVNQLAFQSLASPRNNFVTLTEADPNAPEAIGSVIPFGDDGSAAVSIQSFDLMTPRGMRRIQSLTAGQPDYWGGQSRDQAGLVEIDPLYATGFAWLEIALHAVPPRDGVDGVAISNGFYGKCTDGASTCSCPLHVNLTVNMDTTPLQAFLVEWDYTYFLQFEKFRNQISSIPYFADRDPSPVQMVPCLLTSGTILWTPIHEKHRDEANTILLGKESMDLKFDQPWQLLEHAGILIAGEDNLYLCAG